MGKQFSIRTPIPFQICCLQTRAIFYLPSEFKKKHDFLPESTQNKQNSRSFPDLWMNHLGFESIWDHFSRSWSGTASWRSISCARWLRTHCKLVWETIQGQRSNVDGPGSVTGGPLDEIASYSYQTHNVLGSLSRRNQGKVLLLEVPNFFRTSSNKTVQNFSPPNSVDPLFVRHQVATMTNCLISIKQKLWSNKKPWGFFISLIIVILTKVTFMRVSKRRLSLATCVVPKLAIEPVCQHNLVSKYNKELAWNAKGFGRLTYAYPLGPSIEPRKEPSGSPLRPVLCEISKRGLLFWSGKLLKSKMGVCISVDQWTLLIRNFGVRIDSVESVVERKGTLSPIFFWTELTCRSTGGALAARILLALID